MLEYRATNLASVYHTGCKEVSPAIRRLLDWIDSHDHRPAASTYHPDDTITIYSYGYAADGSEMFFAHNGPANMAFARQVLDY